MPIHSRGIEANKAEYLNYLNHPDLVAETLECDQGLLQEKLSDTTIYPIQVKESDILPEHLNLYKNWKQFMHNRLQVGLSRDGCWKIFDCEDVKYYMKKI